MPPSCLTPRNIALGHLIDLYATADMSLEARQQLYVGLVLLASLCVVGAIVLLLELRDPELVEVG